MIVFFHGFAATGHGSSKAALLRDHFGTRAEVVTPTYPCGDPDATCRLLTAAVSAAAKAGEPLLIGGISFGGFWARRVVADFPGAGLLMINPALDGAATLARYAGLNTNYDSGETFEVTAAAARAAAAYAVGQDRPGQPMLVLLAADDDVVPPGPARLAFEGRPGARVIVAEDAGHRFSRFEEMLPDIAAFHDGLPAWTSARRL
ncbi:MAG TPA: YqiA/YcfP family alpha/beta fold hydrolase [Magnetospirillum sp.]|nr:YqiA/YcfP family alpha/beta fold hydrolase [Magnetospirillum sp.]